MIFGSDIRLPCRVVGWTQYNSTREPEKFIILIPLDVLLFVAGAAVTTETSIELSNATAVTKW
jgi:hypothetical protein